MTQRDSLKMYVGLDPLGLIPTSDLFVPLITVHPANTSVVAGQTAVFTVTAQGTPSYQWEKQEGGIGVWTAIAGATSSTLNYVTTTIVADNGDRFRVIVSNMGGSVTSNEAILTVT